MQKNAMLTIAMLLSVISLVLGAGATFSYIAEPVVSGKNIVPGLNHSVVQLAQILADSSITSRCIRFEQISNITPTLTLDPEYLETLNANDFLKNWQKYLQDTHTNYIYFITNFKNVNPDKLRPSLVGNLNAIINSKKGEQEKMMEIVLEFNGTSPQDKLSFPGSSYIAAFNNANVIMEKKVADVLDELKWYVKKNT